MKSKFWSLIFNPLTRIAGWQAFFAGLAITALTAVAGTLSGVVFDGALDARRRRRQAADFAPQNRFTKLSTKNRLCVLEFRVYMGRSACVSEPVARRRPTRRAAILAMLVRPTAGDVPKSPKSLIKTAS